VALRSVLDKPDAKEHEMSRHPEPQIVTVYKEWLQAGPPKCCHTCEMYGTDGLCVEFFMKPPADFAESVDLCLSWVCEVPF